MEEQKKAKRLVQALWASIALNVLLLCFSVYEIQEMGYFLLRKAQYKPFVGPKAQLEHTLCLEDRLLECAKKNREELFVLLEDRGAACDGYAMCDLAISALVTLHHFDYKRVLSKEERVVQVGDVRFTLVPGLTERDFESVVHFARMEKYPFTSEGLFLQMKGGASDEGLKEAFCGTEAFRVVEALFSRGGKGGITRDAIVELVLSGDWKMVAQFVEGQKKAEELTDAKRRAFLLEYLAVASKPAARLLFTCDREYVLHKLTDKEAMSFLEALEGTEQYQEYALLLLNSPRSNAVHEVAKNGLAQALGWKGKVPGKDEFLAYLRGEKKADTKSDVKKVAQKKVEAKPEVKSKTVVQKKEQKVVVKEQKKVTQPVAKKQTQVTTPVTQTKRPKEDLRYVVRAGDTL